MSGEWFGNDFYVVSSELYVFWIRKLWVIAIEKHIFEKFACRNLELIQMC